MWIYGYHAVLECLRSEKVTVRQVLLSRNRKAARLAPVREIAEHGNHPVRLVADETLRERTGTDQHQGLAAEIEQIPFTKLDQVLETGPQRLLLLDGIEDPQNLGAVLRTAEAAGTGAVLLPQRRSCGLTPAVVKAGAGAPAHLPICSIGNVAQTLDHLKEMPPNFWVVGLDMSGDLTAVEIDRSLPLVIVVGSEHRGLRRLVREKCDFLVRLPMKGRIESLNLSVAAGVLLYSLLPVNAPSGAQ